MDKYQVFIDGASKGNPGHAGMGIVIQDPDGEVLHQIGEYIGILTNNQAEYSALIKALEKLKQLSAKEAKIFSDSELLVRQWNGEYQVKDPKIRELFFKAKNISSNINLNVVHIKREKNFLADKIATEAVKAHGKSKDRQQDISVNINKSDLDESNEEIQVSAGGIVYKKEGSNIKVCLIAKKKK